MWLKMNKWQSDSKLIHKQTVIRLPKVKICEFMATNDHNLGVTACPMLIQTHKMMRNVIPLFSNWVDPKSPKKLREQNLHRSQKGRNGRKNNYFDQGMMAGWPLTPCAFSWIAWSAKPEQTMVKQPICHPDIYQRPPRCPISLGFLVSAQLQTCWSERTVAEWTFCLSRVKKGRPKFGVWSLLAMMYTYIYTYIFTVYTYICIHTHI